MNDEQRTELSDKDKAIAERIALKAPNDVCPFCFNKRWFFLQENGLYPSIMLSNSNRYPTYSLACTNCGFVRQHIQLIVDGEIEGEVEYAKPR